MEPFVCKGPRSCLGVSPPGMDAPKPKLKKIRIERKKKFLYDSIFSMILTFMRFLYIYLHKYEEKILGTH